MRAGTYSRNCHRSWSLHRGAEEDRREHGYCSSSWASARFQEGREAAAGHQEGKRCPKKTLREFRLKMFSRNERYDALKADKVSGSRLIRLTLGRRFQGAGHQGVIKLRLALSAREESHGTTLLPVMAVLWAPFPTPSRVLRVAARVRSHTYIQGLAILQVQEI